MKILVKVSYQYSPYLSKVLQGQFSEISIQACGSGEQALQFLVEADLAGKSFDFIIIDASLDRAEIAELIDYCNTNKFYWQDSVAFIYYHDSDKEAVIKKLGKDNLNGMMFFPTLNSPGSLYDGIRDWLKNKANNQLIY